MTTALEIAVPSNRLQSLTESEIKGQVQLIQRVMKAVMKEGVHYGVVPGTPKKSLWKPGAEVLQATFRIAPSYRAEDLSDGDCIRYRVTALGTHQTSGTILGEGMGEASSNEEKYRWKRAGKREFGATDESRRRVKFGYDREKREEYEVEQVRTEPADVANTILKMACKRAQVAMVLNVTAASDIFTQDLEDLPEGMVDQETGEVTARGKPATEQPKASTTKPKGLATEKQIKFVAFKLDQSGIPENEFLTQFRISKVDGLPFDQVDAALAWISKYAA